MWSLHTATRFHCGCARQPDAGRWRGRTALYCKKGAGQKSKKTILALVAGKHARSGVLQRRPRLEGSEGKEEDQGISRKPRIANRTTPSPEAGPGPNATPEDNRGDQLQAQHTVRPQNSIAPIISRSPHGRLSADSRAGQQDTVEKARHVEQQGGGKDRKFPRPINHGSQGSTRIIHNGGEGGSAEILRSPPGWATRGPQRSNSAVPYGRRNVDSRVRKTGHSSKGSSAGRVQSKQINEAIVEAGRRRSYKDILQLVTDNGASFNHFNIATALHRLGSCGLDSSSDEARLVLRDARFSQLMRLAEAKMTSFGARGTANCLWALAKLGYQQVPTALATSDSSGRSDVSNGGVLPKDEGGRLLGSLCARTEVVMSDLLGQEVSNTIWALGTLGHFPGKQFLQSLTQRLLLLLPEVTPQGVANSFLGLAKLGWSPESDVMDRLMSGALPKIADFNPQELSNTLWALARLGHCSDQLQTAIFQQALKSLSGFNSQNVSNLIWAAATLGLRNARPDAVIGDMNRACGSGAMLEVLLRRCCDQAVATLQSYTPQSLANLTWAIAKIGYTHKPLMRAVAGQAARQLARTEAGEKPEGGNYVAGGEGSGPHHWSGQEIANTTWAFATLGIQPGNRFLIQVCRHLSSPRYLPSYKWQALSNTVWALAVLGHHDKEVLGVVEREVAARMRSVTADTADRDRAGEGEVAAKMRSVTADTAGGEVAEDGLHMTRLLVPAHPDLRPQNVSNLMWAFASLQHPAPELFAALLPLLRHRHHLHLFSGQALSNCIWAAARLGEYDPEVMDIVAEHIRHHCLLLLYPQALANIAWAYAELRHERRDLFDGLVEGLLLSMSPSTMRSVRGTVTVTDGSRSVKLQELISTCRAACMFGWRYAKLLKPVLKLLSTFASHGQLQQTDGTCGVKCVVLSADPDGEAWRPPEGMQQLEARAVCNLVWALSLVGACSPQMWGHVMALLGRMLVAQPGEVHGPELLADEELAQVYQAYLHVQLDYPTAVLAPGPPRLIERAANVWQYQSCTAVQVSSFQEAVSLALTRLRLRHRAELLTSDGLFSIDLAIEVKVNVAGQSSATGPHLPTPQSPGLQGSAVAVRPVDTASRAAVASGGSCSGGSLEDYSTQVVRVAVEVDGPWHFTANTHRPLSTTLYRHRSLEARGWRVVSVPYWRWSECESSFTKQDTLMRKLLQDAGLQVVLEAVKRQ